MCVIEQPRPLGKTARARPRHAPVSCDPRESHPDACRITRLRLGYAWPHPHGVSSALEAYGRAAETEISLLSEGEEDWVLLVESGRLTVEFPIASPTVAREILDFLRTNRGATSAKKAKKGQFRGVAEGTTVYSMVAELSVSESVSVRKDGESGERFFLAIDKGDHRMFIDLRGGEVDQLIGALDQLWNDWASEPGVAR